MKNFKIILLTILSAVLLGLTRYDINLHFLVFIAFIPLLFVFKNKLKKRQIGISALIFSSTYLIIVLHWISLVTIGGYIGMFFLFFIYFYILFLLIYFFSKSFPKFELLGFIIFWLSFELFQGIGPFKFPWFNLGYSISEYRNLIQLADIGGNTLLGILILVINYLIFSTLKRFKKRKILLLSLIFSIWFNYGFLRINSIKIQKSKEKIGLIQISLSQEEKWDKDKFAINMQKYKDFSLIAKKKGANLVVWPESAITTYVMRNHFLKKNLIKFSDKNELEIFSGFPHYEIKKDKKKYYYYNSCSLIKKNIEKPYYKNILVPFGEQIPLADRFPFLEKFILGQANFTSGKKIKTFKFGELNFSPLICFEIAFPYLLNKNLEKSPDFFVNLTNDAWYKKSVGTYQHAEIAKIRAVESRKSIFRVANTGISLIADPTGKITKKIGLYEKDVIVAEIPLTESKSLYSTIFKSYEKILLIISILMAILTIYKLKFI